MRWTIFFLVREKKCTMLRLGTYSKLKRCEIQYQFYKFSTGFAMIVSNCCSEKGAESKGKTLDCTVDLFFYTVMRAGYRDTGI